MTDGSASRARAADLAHRVLAGGAYSNVLVRNATSGLSRQDARFVQRLLYTVLRLLPRLDHSIAAYADRPHDRIDSVTLDGLRVGAAELLFLESSPYAAVDAAVDAVRGRGAPRAAGFVNAVLRRMAVEGEADLPPGPEGAAMRLGVTPWLYRRLTDTWGREETEAFLAASNRPARVGLRMSSSALVEAGAPVPGIPGARWCDDPAVVASLVEQRAASVADPASTAVGSVVAAAPGMRVADLAAAPGGKTLHLADETDSVRARVHR